MKQNPRLSPQSPPISNVSGSSRKVYAQGPSSLGSAHPGSVGRFIEDDDCLDVVPPATSPDAGGEDDGLLSKSVKQKSADAKPNTAGTKKKIKAADKLADAGWAISAMRKFDMVDSRTADVLTRDFDAETRSASPQRESLGGEFAQSFSELLARPTMSLLDANKADRDDGTWHDDLIHAIKPAHAKEVLEPNHFFHETVKALSRPGSAWRRADYSASSSSLDNRVDMLSRPGTATPQNQKPSDAFRRRSYAVARDGENMPGNLSLPAHFRLGSRSAAAWGLSPGSPDITRSRGHERDELIMPLGSPFPPRRFRGSLY